MVLAVWLLFLLIVSLIPVPGFKTHLPADKLEHFIAYGITAVLVMRHFISRGRKARLVILSVLIASLYGALLEVLQGLTPYRQPSLGDVLANTAGAVVFALAYAAGTKKKSRVA
jgi:VanZ family protein